MVRRLAYVLCLVLLATGLLGWSRIPTLPQLWWSVLDVTAPDNPRHPLNRGLIAHWQVLPQTNQAGSVWRSTAPLVSPFPGALTGMLPTSTASGWNATARPGGFGEMRFDGTNDYVNLGVNTVGLRMGGASGTTLALWVKYTSLAGGGENLVVHILGTGDITMLRLGFPGAGGGEVRLGGRSIWSDGFQEIVSAGTVAAGTWTHVVGVADYAGSTMALYRNGVLDTSTGVTFANATFQNDASAAADVLGATFVGTYEFVGALDDIRILTRALSAPEVAALYDATSSRHNPTLQWLPHLVAQPSSALAVKPRRSGSY